MSGLVVGYDGSACSRAALRWGLAEAAVHGWPVSVVSVLEARPVPSAWTASVLVPPREDELAEARKQAVEAAGKIAADLGTAPPADVSVRVGHAGPILVEAADGADLLVVGSHGHGAMERLLLGSVSTFVVHHAPCPVTVIRADE